MFTTLYTWLQSHPLDLPLIMFVINVMISNMPDPDTTSGKGYRWFYGTAHGVIGGVGNVVLAAKVGQQPKEVKP